MPTPREWLALLEPRLDQQRRDIQVYEDYYNGNHRLAFATAKFRATFGDLFTTLADNWCEIVVDAPVERLTVEGFRFPLNDGDSRLDQDAWAIWQENNLDAESPMAHTEAVKDGKAFVLVAPPEFDGDSPIITVEHPSQVIVAHAAGNRRVRLAALKKWTDEDGYAMATVYLPDGIHRFRARQPIGQYGLNAETVWGERLELPFVENPLGVVPMLPLYNNPTMVGGGRSDLLPAIPIQDAINKELADMLIASEFAAFPQRVLMGVDVPKDPETGEPLPGVELKAAVSRFWAFDNENAKVAEFSAANLSNYVAPIEMLIRHLAAQTRTPPHYLLGEIVNASGDALKAAETGLVAKVRRKQIDFADTWEEAIRLALRVSGAAVPAKASAAETIWGDPEYRSEGEVVDAAVKRRTLGIPLEQIWADIGYSPQQIETMKNMAGLPDRPPAGATTSAVPSNGDVPPLQ